jgi:hypothetical protein
VGQAKILASYAGDLPRVDVTGAKRVANVRGIGDAYGYSGQEVRSAQMAGKPLVQRKANAARNAYDRLVNSIAFNGDSKNGLQGILHYPNVPKAAVAQGAGSGTPRAWVGTSKTPDEIIFDVNDILNDIPALTNGVEKADTLLLPIREHSHIATTRLTDSDTTILDFLKKAHPGVEFKPVHEMAGITTDPVDGTTTAAINVMIAYKRDPDKLTLELPMPFMQHAPQQRGLEIVVPCEGRTGGIIVYYPLSVSIRTRI